MSNEEFINNFSNEKKEKGIVLGQKDYKIKKVIKRDGRIVDFDPERIKYAVERAMKAVGAYDKEKLEKVVDYVIKVLEEKYDNTKYPTVEEIQDIVELSLLKFDLYDVAKAYISYRKEKEKIREEKKNLLGKFYEEEVAKRFSVNSIRLMVNRYLLRNENKELIEGPKQMFERVAALIVIPDILYDERIYDKEGKQKVHPKEEFGFEKNENKYGLPVKDPKFRWNRYHLERMKYLYDYLNERGHMKVSWSEFIKMLENGEFDKYYENFYQYYDLMVSKRFMPNSPTLFNAGAVLGQLSACFVLDIDDNMESIMKSATEAALIFKSGGGIGINYSKLRPEGDVVASTGGVASGPVSFMKIIDTITDVVKQGGKRRGANMGILESWHPEIFKFIHLKEKEGVLENFNISIMFEPSFWEYFENKKEYPLINPRLLRKYNLPLPGDPNFDINKIPKESITGYVNPERILQEASYVAWEKGDPGCLFMDNINRRNVQYKYRGPIRATNPCVTGDTRILTPYGLLRAETLLYLNNENGSDINNIKLLIDGEGEILYTTVHGKTLSVSSPILVDAKVWRVGFKPTVKLILENGMEIEVTEDHKILTKDGWVEAKYAEGKEVKIARIDIDKIENYGLKEVDGIKLDRELGFLLGWLVGDGYVGEKVFFYFNAKTEKEVSEYVKELLEKKFGVNVSKYERNNEIWIYVSKKEVVEIFKKLMRKKTSLPEIVFLANSEFVKGFLSGLFSADGYIDKDGAIRLTSSNKDLLKEVQLLLTLFGIFSKIYERPYKRKFEYITVNGEKREYEANGYYELIIKNYSRKIFEEKIKLVNYKNEKLLNRLKKTKIDDNYVKIVRVEYVGEKMVYDFSVPGFNRYISNGIVSHNCGEQPLYPYESCNLGSINLYALVEFKDGKAEFNWDKYIETIKWAYRLLDNVIDVNKYPIKEIEEASKAVRRVGLGYMGLADMFYALGIPYTSEEGYRLLMKITEYLTYYSMLESVERAKTRGKFDRYNQTTYKDGELPVEGYYHKELWTLDWEYLKEQIMKYGIRNVEVTSIAPTGSISMLADTSSGIEPQYSLVYEKRVTAGVYYYVDQELERQLRERGLYNNDILKKISDNGGSLFGIKEIPDDLKAIFLTALDIPWWDHIRAQAVAQIWITTSISKTINMPNWVQPDDVYYSYLLAHKMGCKGITIYRDGSRSAQVYVAPAEASKARFMDYFRLVKEGKINNRTVEILKQYGIKLPNWYYELTTNVEVPKVKLNANINNTIKVEENGNNKIEKCPVCGSTRLKHEAGCVVCMDCGWSECIIA